MLLVWHGTIWNLAFYLLTSVFITFARHLEQPKTSLPRQISALRAPLFKTNVLFEAECKKLCTMDPECTFLHQSVPSRSISFLLAQRDFLWTAAVILLLRSNKLGEGVV